MSRALGLRPGWPRGGNTGWKERPRSPAGKRIVVARSCLVKADLEKSRIRLPGRAAGRRLAFRKADPRGSAEACQARFEHFHGGIPGRHLIEISKAGRSCLFLTRERATHDTSRELLGGRRPPRDANSRSLNSPCQEPSRDLFETSRRRAARRDVVLRVFLLRGRPTSARTLPAGLPGARARR